MTKDFMLEHGEKFANGHDKNIFPMIPKEFESWDDKNNCPETYIADIPDEVAMENIFGCKDVCICNIGSWWDSGNWYFIPTSKLIEFELDIPEPMDGFKSIVVRSIGKL